MCSGAPAPSLVLAVGDYGTALLGLSGPGERGAPCGIAGRLAA